MDGPKESCISCHHLILDTHPYVIRRTDFGRHSISIEVFHQPCLYLADLVSSVHMLCAPTYTHRPGEVECVICVCLRELHGSERLTWLLWNGENHHQVLWVPNNAPAQIIDPLYSQRLPLSERERACDSSSYCITTRGNDTNPDNFHHHGWEQLGLAISEILLLKYSRW